MTDEAARRAALAEIDRLRAAVADMGDTLATPPHLVAAYDAVVGSLDPAAAGRLRFAPGDSVSEPRHPAPYLRVAAFRSRLDEAHALLGGDGLPG